MSKADDELTALGGTPVDLDAELRDLGGVPAVSVSGHVRRASQGHARRFLGVPLATSRAAVTSRPGPATAHQALSEFGRLTSLGDPGTSEDIPGLASVPSEDLQRERTQSLGTIGTTVGLSMLGAGATGAGRAAVGNPAARRVGGQLIKELVRDRGPIGAMSRILRAIRGPVVPGAAAVAGAGAVSGKDADMAKAALASLSAQNPAIAPLLTALFRSDQAATEP